VEIVGSATAANLAAHVGHKIEIIGTAVSAKKAAKAEGDKKNMKEERKRAPHAGAVGQDARDDLSVITEYGCEDVGSRRTTRFPTFSHPQNHQQFAWPI
jgi:hypothetical protein